MRFKKVLPIIIFITGALSLLTALWVGDVPLDGKFALSGAILMFAAPFVGMLFSLDF